MHSRNLFFILGILLCIPGYTQIPSVTDYQYPILVELSDHQRSHKASKAARRSRFYAEIQGSDSLDIVWIRLKSFDKMGSPWFRSFSLYYNQEVPGQFHYKWQKAETLKRKQVFDQLEKQVEVFIGDFMRNRLERAFIQHNRKLFILAGNQNAPNASGISGDDPTNYTEMRGSYLNLWEDQFDRFQMNAGIVSDERKLAKLERIDESFRKKLKLIDDLADKERKRFRKFLKGKGSSRFATRPYEFRIRFPYNLEELDPASIRFQVNQGRKKEVMAIQWTNPYSLGITSYWGQEKTYEWIVEHLFFNWIDTVDCVENFSMNSWMVDDWQRISGSLVRPQTPQYPRYSPQPPGSRQEVYQVTFTHNQSVADTAQLLPIITLLRDSSLVIDTAHIKAFASIEGSEENNHRLQRERSQVIINLLTSYNQDSIPTSIVTAEAWDQWSNQLRNSDKLRDSKYRDWLYLERDSVKKFLENPDELQRLEPWLQNQRRATLYLNFTERFTDEIKIEKIERDLHRLMDLYYQYPDDQSIRQKVRVRLQSMRHYARILLVNDWLTLPDSLNSAIFALHDPWLDYTDFLEELLFFKYDSTINPERFKQAALRAFDTNMGIASRMIRNGRTPKAVTTSTSRMLMIQIILYQEIQNGRLDSTLFCEMASIPKDQAFRANQYLYHLFGTIQDYPREGNSYCPPLPQEHIVYRGNSTDSNPVASESQYSPLYLIRRQRYLEAKEQLKDEEIIHDLIFLLFVNIEKWQPLSPDLYDEIFPPEKMLEDFKRLETLQGQVCETTIAALRVNLFNKYLIYDLLNSKSAKGVYSETSEILLDQLSTYYSTKKYSSDVAIHLGNVFMKWGGVLGSSIVYGYGELALAPQDHQSPSSYQASRYLRASILTQKDPAALLVRYADQVTSDEWCELLQMARPFLSPSDRSYSQVISLMQTKCR